MKTYQVTYSIAAGQRAVGDVTTPSQIVQPVRAGSLESAQQYVERVRSRLQVTYGVPVTAELQEVQ